MNAKAEFLIDTLKEYAKENQTIVRGTDDLSPLETWLIMRLFTSRDSRILSAVPSDFVHRIFIIMDGDKELERLADADTAIDLLLIHQNGEHPRARIFKMKI